MQIQSDRPEKEILSHIKALLLITDGERDSALLALLEDAYTFAVSYTGNAIIPSALLSRMVCEDYSKTQGVTRRAVSSMSEEYINGYSKSVITLLNGARRLKAV